MKLLRTYSVNMAEFLTGTGEMTPEINRSGETKQIPLLLWTHIIFALKVKGNSMEPGFSDGDILIVNPNMKSGGKDLNLLFYCSNTSVISANPKPPSLDVIQVGVCSRSCLNRNTLATPTVIGK
ncbi:MAG: S24 family peptidase [Proteobacteria bacterium]|nr:S24 family peptidase [Pseudomonadota bacterium]